MKSYGISIKDKLGVKSVWWLRVLAPETSRPGFEPQLCHFLRKDLRQVISLRVLIMDQIEQQHISER